MSVEIREATLDDKQAVLKCLDEFNDYAHVVDGHEEKTPSTFSQQNSGNLYNKIISSSTSKVFIAVSEEKVVGFLEVHIVPRLRKANFFGEIESMFVTEDLRGTGVASDLMGAAIRWAKEQKLDCLRLYTVHKLERAHAFYEKMGFIHAGRTYKYPLG